MSDTMKDLLHGIFPDHLGGVYLPPLVPYIALVGILGFILTIVPGLIWIERVVIALMQDRSGPNRVGPRGLLQTLADGVKLFFKEEIRPRSVDVRIYYLAPVIAMIPALAGGAVLSLQIVTFRAQDGHLFGVPLTVGDVNIGLLYILAMSSLQVYGVVLAGWSSNNKYSLLGGLRASAQLISYELSMGLALLCVVLLAGSLKLTDIVAAQNVLPAPGAPEILRGSIFSWYWLQSGVIPVVLYTIAMIAETNRAPFDLPEAESELIAGFHTEYTSMKFAMFFMGEYASMLTVCGLNAAMFWGGSLPPLNIPPLTLIPGFVWFILKVMMGIWFYVWLRATLPRLRYDALMQLGWKRMLPLGLVWLFLMAGYSMLREPNHNRVAAVQTVSPDQDDYQQRMQPGARGNNRRSGGGAGGPRMMERPAGTPESNVPPAILNPDNSPRRSAPGPSPGFPTIPRVKPGTEAPGGSTGQTGAPSNAESGPSDATSAGPNAQSAPTLPNRNRTPSGETSGERTRLDSPDSDGDVPAGGGGR